MVVKTMVMLEDGEGLKGGRKGVSDRRISFMGLRKVYSFAEDMRMEGQGGLSEI